MATSKLRRRPVPSNTYYEQGPTNAYYNNSEAYGTQTKPMLPGPHPTSSTETSLVELTEDSTRSWPLPSSTAILSPHQTSEATPYVDGNKQYSTPYRDSHGASIAFSGMSTNPSKASLRPKNQTGFKATIRRIFSGRKRHSTISELEPSYHLSDPGNLMSPSVEPQQSLNVAQAPSQLQPTATRSSSIAPASSRESYKPSRWEPPTDWRTLLPGHRRRNTLPSIVLSQQEAQMIARALDYKITSSEQYLPRSNIEDPGQNSRALKRRSRSADALNELALGLGDDHRNRESEIAYWRNSTVDPYQPESHDETMTAAMDVKRLTRDALAHEIRPPAAANTTPQKLGFGLLHGTNSSLSLGERVSTLEVKMIDFEYAIATLQGNLAQSSLAPKPPSRRSIHDLFPAVTSQQLEHNSPPDPYTPTQPPSGPLLTTMRPASQMQGLRLSRSDTIRPSTARQPIYTKSAKPGDVSLVAPTDNYEVILQLVREEQIARQRLESQVQDLQREIDDLRTPVYAYIRPATIPTPSPESKYRRLMTPKARTLHRTPAFGPKDPPTVVETSRFSMTDDGSVVADDMTNSTDDDQYQDEYESAPENRYTFESSRSYPSP